MKRKIIYIVTILSMSAFSLFAQTDLGGVGQSGVDLKKTGQTTFNFLQIMVSPRASAMGNASTALNQGIESIFTNPAGLPEMTSDFGLFISSTQWIADIKYLAGAVAWKTDLYGSIGLSYIAVDYGTIRGAALVPGDQAGSNPDGYILTDDIQNVGAYSLGLTYVKDVSTKFAIGGTIKYVGQKLGQSIDAEGKVSDNNANKIAFDLGVKYFTGIESLRLGMSMRNFSTFVKYHSFQSPLPIAFSVGLGMNMMDIINKDISKENALILTAEFVHPNDYTDRVKTGLEYTFMNFVSLRAGYVTNHDILSWSGGIGFAYSIGDRKIEIDYSYSNAEYFDAVNRFALTVGF